MSGGIEYDPFNNPIIDGEQAGFAQQPPETSSPPPSDDSSQDTVQEQIASTYGGTLPFTPPKAVSDDVAKSLADKPPTETRDATHNVTAEEQTAIIDINRRIMAGETLTDAEKTAAKEWLPGSADFYDRIHGEGIYSPKLSQEEIAAGVTSETAQRAAGVKVEVTTPILSDAAKFEKAVAAGELTYVNPRTGATEPIPVGSKYIGEGQFLTPEAQANQVLLDKIQAGGGALKVYKDNPELAQRAVELALIRDPSTNAPLTMSDLAQATRTVARQELVDAITSSGGILEALRDGKVETVKQAITQGLYRDANTHVPLTLSDLAQMQSNLAKIEEIKQARLEIAAKAPGTITTNSDGTASIAIVAALTAGVEAATILRAGITQEVLSQEVAKADKLAGQKMMSDLLGSPLPKMSLDEYTAYRAQADNLTKPTLLASEAIAVGLGMDDLGLAVYGIQQAAKDKEQEAYQKAIEKYTADYRKQYGEGTFGQTIAATTVGANIGLFPLPAIDVLMQPGGSLGKVSGADWGWTAASILSIALPKVLEIPAVSRGVGKLPGAQAVGRTIDEWVQRIDGTYEPGIPKTLEPTRGIETADGKAFTVRGNTTEEVSALSATKPSEQSYFLTRDQVTKLGTVDTASVKLTLNSDGELIARGLSNALEPVELNLGKAVRDPVLGAKLVEVYPEGVVRFGESITNIYQEIPAEALGIRTTTPTETGAMYASQRTIGVPVEDVVTGQVGIIKVQVPANATSAEIESAISGAKAFTRGTDPPELAGTLDRSGKFTPAKSLREAETTARAQVTEQQRLNLVAQAKEVAIHNLSDLDNAQAIMRKLVEEGTPSTEGFSEARASLSSRINDYTNKVLADRYAKISAEFDKLTTEISESTSTAIAQSDRSALSVQKLLNEERTLQHQSDLRSVTRRFELQQEIDSELAKLASIHKELESVANLDNPTRMKLAARQRELLNEIETQATKVRSELESTRAQLKDQAYRNSPEGQARQKHLETLTKEEEKLRQIREKIYEPKPSKTPSETPRTGGGVQTATRSTTSRSSPAGAVSSLGASAPTTISITSTPVAPGIVRVMGPARQPIASPTPATTPATSPRVPTSPIAPAKPSTPTETPLIRAPELAPVPTYTPGVAPKSPEQPQWSTPRAPEVVTPKEPTKAPDVSEPTPSTTETTKTGTTVAPAPEVITTRVPSTETISTTDRQPTTETPRQPQPQPVPEPTPPKPEWPPQRIPTTPIPPRLITWLTPVGGGVGAGGGASGGGPNLPLGSVVWKQGFVWKYIVPPYNQLKPTSSRYPPRGVLVTKGTPQETLTFIGGKIPFTNISFDLGETDGFIDVKARQIVFGGGGTKTDVGKRISGNTTGMSIPAKRPPMRGGQIKL